MGWKYFLRNKNRSPSWFWERPSSLALQRRFQCRKKLNFCCCFNFYASINKRSFKWHFKAAWDVLKWYLLHIRRLCPVKMLSMWKFNFCIWSKLFKETFVAATTIFVSLELQGDQTKYFDHTLVAPSLMKYHFSKNFCAQYALVLQGSTFSLSYCNTHTNYKLNLEVYNIP